MNNNQKAIGNKGRNAGLAECVLFWCIAIGVVLGAIWLVDASMGSKWPADSKATPVNLNAAPVERVRTKEEIRAACQRHLGAASRKADGIVAARANQVTRFIQSRKAGARLFAEKILSKDGFFAVAKGWGQSLARGVGLGAARMPDASMSPRSSAGIFFPKATWSP